MTNKKIEKEMNEIAWVHRLIQEIRYDGLTPAQLRYLRGIFEMGMWQCEGHLGEGESVQEDSLLKVKDAAKLLGYSEDYVYRHAKDFSFTRRMPSCGKRKNLRFSRNGIQDYMRSQGNGTR